MSRCTLDSSVMHRSYSVCLPSNQSSRQVWQGGRKPRATRTSNRDTATAANQVTESSRTEPDPPPPPSNNPSWLILAATMEKEEATGATHRALNVTSRRRGTRINSRITVLSPRGWPGGIQRINNDWTPLRTPLAFFFFFRLVHSAPGERESGGGWGMCEIAELGTHWNTRGITVVQDLLSR